jgi:hypothetical protein
MKHLIQYWWSIKRMLFCVAAVVPALSWGFGAQAYHLVDDATGKALVTLPSGEPEAFFAVGGRLLFVGHNTNTRVEQDVLSYAMKTAGCGLRPGVAMNTTTSHNIVRQRGVLITTGFMKAVFTTVLEISSCMSLPVHQKLLIVCRLPICPLL